jgi:hypothetical protein
MSFTLTEANFRYYAGNGAVGGAVTQSDFQSILANAVAVAVYADWRSDVIETTWLDNVVLTTPDVNPVPLPGALPLFASVVGLGGFLGFRRRRAAVS